MYIKVCRWCFAVCAFWVCLGVAICLTPASTSLGSCSLTVYDGEECGIRYKLLGVVEHQGRMTSGHYVSHVRVSGDAPALLSAANLDLATVSLYAISERQLIMYPFRMSPIGLRG